MYLNEVDEETLTNSKKKQKILNSAIKTKSRKVTFKYITNHIGRGKRKNLIRVYEVNNNKEIVKTYVGKEEIEREIMKHNRKHFIEAYQTKAFQDKIYEKLQNDEVRERILNGKL